MMKKIIPGLAVLSVLIFCNVAFASNILRDISYGPAPAQVMDVYKPEHAANAPVIFMVHGGGWRHGDKEMGRVIDNKTARWVPAGFIFISVNYPMLPDSSVSEQAENIRKAIAYAQRQASEWGGDKHKFILMGHSAGAHLVSLINADPETVYKLGGEKWLGTVSLDSAAIDIPRVMAGRHMGLYDDAFGDLNEAQQKSLSPYWVLNEMARPWFGVCSTKRDTSCSQGDDFAAKAKTLGVAAKVIREDLTHAEINDTLGLNSDYTKQVEEFMAGLDPMVAQLIGHIPNVAAAPNETGRGRLRDFIAKRRQSLN